LQAGIAGNDETGAAFMVLKSLGVLPAESGRGDSLQLVTQSRRGPSGAADRRETELASEVVWGSANVDLGALRADSLGGEVGKDKAGIDTVGKPTGSTGFEPQRVPAIHSLEPPCLGSTVRQGGENEDAGHEA